MSKNSGRYRWNTNSPAVCPLLELFIYLFTGTYCNAKSCWDPRSYLAWHHHHYDVIVIMDHARNGASTLPKQVIGSGYNPELIATTTGTRQKYLSSIAINRMFSCVAFGKCCARKHLTRRNYIQAAAKITRWSGVVFWGVTRWPPLGFTIVTNRISY